MNKHTILIAICILVFFYFYSCTNNIAGGSSDHGNAFLIGHIYDSSNNGVPDVTLRLLPNNYNPVNPNFPIDSFLVVTDSFGYYEIRKIGKGAYNLVGQNQTNTKGLIKQSIQVESNDIDTLDAILFKYGSIKMPIDTVLFKETGKYSVYLSGTNISKNFHNKDTAIALDSIPMGIHTLRIYDHIDDSSFIQSIDFNNFFVMAGGITNFFIQPYKPRGPDTADVNNECKFFTFFEYWNDFPDLIVEKLEYRFSWGDSDTSKWSTQISSMNTWSTPGVYNVRVQMRYGINNNEADNQTIDSIIPFYSRWSMLSTIHVTKSYVP